MTRTRVPTHPEDVDEVPDAEPGPPSGPRPAYSGEPDLSSSVLTELDLSVPGGAAMLDGEGYIPRAQNPDRDRFNVKDYGAVGDGVSDDTAEIQAALDAAAAVYGVVTIPRGRYIVSSTLHLHPAVDLVGLDRGDPSSGQRPSIIWAGVADGTVLVIDTDAIVTRTINAIRSLRFWAPTTLSTPRYIIDVKMRADQFLLEDVALQVATEYGIWFRAGGHNVHLRNFRTDGIGIGGAYSNAAGIGWVQTAMDSLSMNDFTIDNGPLPDATGGCLYVDATGTHNDRNFFVSVNKGKFENNSDMVAGAAAFRFDVDPDQAPPVNLRLEFNSVWQTNIGGATNKSGIKINPAYAYVTLVARNTDLRIEGIPGYDTSSLYLPSFLGHHHVDSVIAPFGPRSGAGFAGSFSVNKSIHELHVDTNITGHGLYRHGQTMKSVIALSPLDSAWNSNPVTVYPGQLFEVADQSSASFRRWEVTTAGTLGTLVGVTADTTAGSAVIVVNTTDGIREGDVLTLNAQSRTVKQINRSTNTVTLSGTISATLTGTAVVYTAPTLTDAFQAASVGVGTPPVADQMLTTSGAIPGTATTQYGARFTAVGAATATSSAYGVQVQGGTSAAAYTCSTVQSLSVLGPSKGSGSTISNAYTAVFGAPTTGSTANYTLALQAAGTATLWVGYAADSTTAAAGIFFGQSRDTNLHRKAANRLGTDDQFVAASLGVGNSAAATTLGTVVKKIEVFDASGVSLGYLPVYDVIT